MMDELDMAKIESLLDDLIDEDPERVERFIESQLAKIALRRRLKARREAALTEKQEPVAWPEAPKEIYLVVCGDDDCDLPFREHGEVTWCEDKIHANDIRYVRADTHPAPVNQQEPRLWQDGDDLTIAYLAGYGKAQERIAELEAALDVALEALEKLNMEGWILADFEDMVYAAIAKLKEVRK